MEATLEDPYILIDKPEDRLGQGPVLPVLGQVIRPEGR